IPIGTDGTTISSIALGTWTFAGDGIWGASEEAACIRVVEAAIDRGITLFDTAPNYGNGRSETVLGKAVGNRTDITVATKCKIDGTRPEDLRKIVTDSLSRLKRDRVDLMQIHWPGATTADTRAALSAFRDLQKEGLVGKIGACNFGVFDLAETNDFPLVSNQIPYSLLWRAVEGPAGIAAQSHDSGLTTIAYTVLQQGLLSGRYTSLDDFPEGRKRTRHFGQQWPGTMHSEAGFEAQTAAALAEFLRVARQAGRPLLELALAFVAGSEEIDSLLIGARDEAQLLASCDAAESEISPDERTALKAATEPLRQAVDGHADMYRSESRVRFPDPRGEPTRTL
nr:aldo/keto reductase [Spirochaeta sp.]